MNSPFFLEKRNSGSSNNRIMSLSQHSENRIREESQEDQKKKKVNKIRGREKWVWHNWRQPAKCPYHIGENGDRKILSPGSLLSVHGNSSEIKMLGHY